MGSVTNVTLGCSFVQIKCDKFETRREAVAYRAMDGGYDTWIRGTVVFDKSYNRVADCHCFIFDGPAGVMQSG